MDRFHGFFFSYSFSDREPQLTVSSGHLDAIQKRFWKPGARYNSNNNRQTPKSNSTNHDINIKNEVSKSIHYNVLVRLTYISFSSILFDIDLIKYLFLFSLDGSGTTSL